MFLDFSSALNFFQQPQPPEVPNLTQAGGSSEGPPSGSSQEAQPKTAQAAQQPAFQCSIRPLTTGSLQERLLNPGQSQVSSLGQETQDVASLFRQAAGSSRTYDSSGAQTALQTAIGPNATSKDTEAARGFLGSSYHRFGR